MPIHNLQIRMCCEYGGQIQLCSSVTLHQRKANELWLENRLSISKTWIDEGHVYTQNGKFITCTKEGYNKLSEVVNNKWLCKKVRVKNNE